MKRSLPPTHGEVRRLGAMFLAAACLLGALAAWKARSGSWPWQAWAAGGFAIAALACLGLGAKAAFIHRAWLSLGVMLGCIATPVVLTVLYLLVVTPFAVVSRAFRRDSLGLRPDRSAATYWREPAVRKTSRAKLLRQY